MYVLTSTIWFNFKIVESFSAQAQKYETFPVLDPPQEFQNCLSPSAIYDTTFELCSPRSNAIYDSTFELCTPRQHYSSYSFEKNVVRASVASPACSHDSMTSSSATEKSVRFSDRDHILSTPEPQQVAEPRPLAAEVKGILKGPAADVIPNLDVTSFMLDSEDGTLV